MNISPLVKTAFTGLAALVMAGIPSDNYQKEGKTYLMKDSSITKGIYKCIAPSEAKTYLFDSENPESKFIWTEKKGIKFKDLLTGNNIKLTEKQDYSCEPVGKTEKNNLNWISVNIWDSFYQLILNKTVPESLMALEVIFYQYYEYNMTRNIKELFRVDYEPLYGKRSRESHYMMWIHLSDDFLKKHPINRAQIGEELFMYPDRETDLFVGWGGEANLPEFISTGVRGLADILHHNGTRTGSFHGFQKAIDNGNPDFEGGLLVTDEQLLKVLKSFQTYPGLTNGYSFLSKIETKLNAPFESKLSQGVNGNNCGDFLYYALTTANIVSTKNAERIKKCLWYAEGFWENPIPSDWSEILTGTGLFDEKKLTSKILQDLPDYRCVRIWEPASSIDEFRKNTFKTKRVIEELLPAILLRSRITNPLPNSPDRYRFRDTEEYQMYLTEGHEMIEEKREKVGIIELENLESAEKTLKKEFLDSLPATNQ
ncbi:MAG: hypothetical protein V1914_01335 [archaeon]